MNNNIEVKFTLIPESDSFARSLGITEERESEIDTLLDVCYEKTETFPECIAEASLKLDTANELAYASFHLGAFAESRRAKYDLLNKILGE